MKPLFAASCFIALALFAAACGGDDPVICTFDGVEHAAGESFPSSDGCNTCTCSNDGEVGCTLMACVAPCTYGGVERDPGSTFPSEDGCNTCSCNDGQVSCTELACPPPTCTYAGETHAIGATFPSEDGCNTCTCGEGGQVACTEMACPPPTCTYGGQTYAIGATFPSADGCNTCSCGEGGAVLCTLMPCIATCSYDGRDYGVGDTFPSTDGCNTCSCGGDGEVSCTTRECVVDTCTYDRQTWEVGATFPAIDGCNTCTCMEGGQLACTDMACPECNADTDWWRRYYGRDAEACAAADFICDQPTTMFANDCGCGCEQDLECAQEIDCFAPGCDYDATVVQCPYSRINTSPGCTVEKPCNDRSGFCTPPGAPFGCGICFRPEEGQECFDDATCAGREARSICEPLHCSCGGERVCVPGCVDDASCGEGERCTDSGRCLPKPCDTDAACPTNFSCLPDGCMRTMCEASSGCDGFCVLGYCFAEEGECRQPVP